MIRLPIFICVLLIGLSMVMAKTNGKFRGIQQGRLSRNNVQMRALRNLMGELIDTDTNVKYKVDAQKQEEIPMDPDTTTTIITPVFRQEVPAPEQAACTAACYSCVKDESLESNKKPEDNCGPMCDCTDSCFLTSVEKVGQIYRQSFKNPNDKLCWWRTFDEFLSSLLPTSA